MTTDTTRTPALQAKILQKGSELRNVGFAIEALRKGATAHMKIRDERDREGRPRSCPALYIDAAGRRWRDEFTAPCTSAEAVRTAWATRRRCGG